MSTNEDIRELLDRTRRIEARLVTFAQAMNVDLMGLVKQVQPETNWTEQLGHHVTVRSLDIPIARIRKAVREAWPGHSTPVPVYFDGAMVSAVMP